MSTHCLVICPIIEDQREKVEPWRQNLFATHEDADEAKLRDVFTYDLDGRHDGNRERHPGESP